MKIQIIALSLLTFVACACGSNSETKGKVDIYENFKSQYVAPRTVRVWTPADYDPQKKYDVLYMHDGQNLFDSTLTWNGAEWGGRDYDTPDCRGQDPTVHCRGNGLRYAQI